jgi:uncharacterized protein (DUF934 family)
VAWHGAIGKITCLGDNVPNNPAVFRCDVSRLVQCGFDNLQLSQADADEADNNAHNNTSIYLLPSAKKVRLTVLPCLTIVHTVVLILLKHV